MNWRLDFERCLDKRWLVRMPGFCASADQETIAGHNYTLTPDRYVGFAEVDEGDEPFEEKMERSTATLEAQVAESTRLEAAIRENLARLENRG